MRMLKHLRVLVGALGSAVLIGTVVASAASPPLRQVSTDPTTGGVAQHQTEGEADLEANGTTIVSAFQVGRFNLNGGSMDTGWATSTDRGATWHSGTLPSFTKASVPAGPYDRTADNTVAYDSVHGVWLISSLGISQTRRGFRNEALVVSRSPDGLSWSAPVVVSSTAKPDKDWIVCDNGASSPFRGTCYAIYSQIDLNLQISISRSTDGGATWSAPATTADHAGGYNTQIAVQPNGTVVGVATQKGNLIAFNSSDQGRTFSTPVVIAPIQHHDLPVRYKVEGAKPSVRVDGQGTVYAVWADCRFRKGCGANDLVLSKSSDGATWSPVTRIPIDPVSGSADHSLPGLGVDPSTGGSRAHLGLVYYLTPDAACTFQCPLYAAFVSSNNGGATWLPQTVLTPAIPTTWLPKAENEGFLGDYTSTVYVAGRPVTVVPVAQAPQGSTFNQSMYAAFPPQTPVLQLIGSVGPGRTASFQPRSGPPGRYTIVVHDRSPTAGFHFKGPGVNRATGRRFVGTVTWHVKLKAGTYHAFTDGPGSRTAVVTIG